jgi:hypothetical protein
MAKKNESGRQAARAGGSSGDASLVTRFGDYVMDNRVLIAWALAACLWTWHGRVHEVDPVHQRHDLDILMKDARVSIDKYLRENNTLPEQLSDTFLAGFIKYTPLNPAAQPPTYSLEGSLMSVTEYWSNVNEGVAK